MTADLEPVSDPVLLSIVSHHDQNSVFFDEGGKVHSETSRNA